MEEADRLLIQKGCPNCGGTLIVELKFMGIAHEMPMCDWFNKSDVYTIINETRKKLEGEVLL